MEPARGARAFIYGITAGNENLVKIGEMYFWNAFRLLELKTVWRFKLKPGRAGGGHRPNCGYWQ
jgi:hypothetical protein